MPANQPKPVRLWLNDGSCVRQRPEHRNHVWSYDLTTDRTWDGRSLKMLLVLDEFSRECLAIRVTRRLRSQDVLDQVGALFVKRGTPKYVRSDNGPEFTAKQLRKWLDRLTVQPLFIEPGSPWENGYVESVIGKCRYEFLNGEIFYSLLEAQVLPVGWQRKYNQIQPHSSPGDKPLAPEAIQPKSVPFPAKAGPAGLSFRN